MPSTDTVSEQPLQTSNKHIMPNSLQQFVASTIDSVLSGTSKESQAKVSEILQRFQAFLVNDEIVENVLENKSFAALYKLLRYGLDYNENRVAEENKTLQACIDDYHLFTVRELRSAVKERMDHAPAGEVDVLKMVSEFNESMLVAFKEQFPTNKQRTYASTVNFVSESGFSKILESIYWASPQQTKEIAYMFLKKVFKNTYDVVQKMDRKQIVYPCVFKEPLRPEDQEDEQIPPQNQSGKSVLCYDFDIGNLYSFLDILSNVLRKMLNRTYITARYQYYSEEKKKNNEEGYISYPLLLSLILKNEPKETVIENMIVMGQGEKDEIKSALLDFIKTLQSSEFLYVYSLKRYTYLKHFVLELLHDKQLAGIPNFYAGMVIACALLSNEQYKAPYGLIKMLMDEKESLMNTTKQQLAESLNQLTPNTLDHLLRYIVKGSYLVAGPNAKKLLEAKFEEAKVLSATQDPLSSIMQGLTEIGTEEVNTIIKKGGDTNAGKTTIMGQEEVNEKFTIWQNLLRQIFKWQVKRIPGPLKWIETTAMQLETHRDRYIAKEETEDVRKRLQGLQLANLPKHFTFFPDKSPKWQDQIPFIDKYHRRRGICLGIERKFKETLWDLIETLYKYGMVHETYHTFKRGGSFRECCIVVKLPIDQYYRLPAGQRKGHVQLFIGIGMIPMKKPSGPIETKPCIFLFQEIPSGFNSEGLHPLTVKVQDATAKTKKEYNILEIPLSESYYEATLAGLLDILQKWMPMAMWDKDAVQKMVGCIYDFQSLVSSSDKYGAVGDEVICNPNRPKYTSKK
ncbi:MAG: hypothetical protein HQM14_02300 [SAR324 cluster bacterium]|nr:hypothetical protein [SAR324 cluster bacterium]